MSPITIVIGCLLFDLLQLGVWIGRVHSTNYQVRVKISKSKGE